MLFNKEEYLDELTSILDIILAKIYLKVLSLSKVVFFSFLYKSIKASAIKIVCLSFTFLITCV